MIGKANQVAICDSRWRSRIGLDIIPVKTTLVSSKSNINNRQITFNVQMLGLNDYKQKLIKTAFLPPKTVKKQVEYNLILA